MFVWLKRIAVQLFERTSILWGKFVVCVRKTFVKNTDNQEVKMKKHGYTTGINPEVALIDKDNWNLLLINKKNILPDDYAIDLTYAVDGYDAKIDSRVAKHFTTMVTAARKDGLNLVPETGYRSIAAQRNSFNTRVKHYLDLGESEEAAIQRTATIFLPPGCSEHNAGLAIDITNLEKRFKNSKEFKWLMKNAVDYGFILRYPKNKKAITEIRYEPWHWRYVGTEDAKAIKARGQCLEEYLKMP